MYGLKTDRLEDPTSRYDTLGDHEGKTARWCTGRGDHAVLQDSLIQIARVTFPSRECSAGFDGTAGRSWGAQAARDAACPLREVVLLEDTQRASGVESGVDGGDRTTVTCPR